MASYDLNATESEAWAAPSVMAANTGKATSESGSRSKMANKPTTGHFRTSLPVNEDLASFAAQLSQDDVARNLLLLTMISGNLPFGNTMTGNMHPLFPSLIPIGLPHQRFNSILPQNPNMAQLQQSISERGNGKPRRRSANRPRSDRRPDPSTSSRPCLNDSTRLRYIDGNTASSVNSNTMQPHSLAANTVDNLEILSRNELALSVGSNSVFTNRARSRDYERNPQRSSAAPVSVAATTRTVGQPITTFGPTVAKSHYKQRYVSPSMTAIRGEARSSKSAAIMKGKYSAARSFKIPSIPSFNEAEAAATLLGMRHGQNPKDRSVLAPQTLENFTTTTASTLKTNHGVTQATNSIPRNRSGTTKFDSYGAVDLSTKTKTVGVPTLQNQCAFNPIATHTGNRLTAWQSKPTVASDRTGAIIDKPRLAVSRAADISKCSDPTVGDIRHDTTSVVSQCGEYICAFDSPASAVRWTDDQSMAPARSTVLDQMHPTHIPAQQQAFNYKKIICEKFSQCTSPGTVTYADSSCDYNDIPNSSNIDRLQNLPIIENFRKDGSCSKPESLMQYAVSASTVPRSCSVSIACQKTSSCTATTLCTALGNQPLFTTGSQGSLTTKKVISEIISDRYRNSQSACCLKDVPSSTIEGIHELGSHNVPSFHELRQKSKDSSVAALGNQKDKHGVVNTSHENSFKSSNLYRIRNSAFGGSNDSLHSNSLKEDSKVIDSESSSCSSDSEESVDESDIEEEGKNYDNVTEAKYAITTINPNIKSSPQRARFILSQAKFTLNNCESNDDNCNESETVAASSVKDHDNRESSKRPPPSVVSKNDTNGTKLHQTKIPELKCDGTEHESTFKYKFIKALSNPDSKEGLAVDGKYLRALLGDQATCFYHNNKKYVLKRYLKPKDAPKHKNETGEASVSPKSARKGSHQEKLSYSPEPEFHRKIEPRISVTAVKRSDTATKSQDKLSKRIKKSKKRFAENSKKKSTISDVDTGRRLERSNMDETKIKLPHNKRRRRNHEIENLIYEGAGGKTPMPDLSLRDSDVFSNIKLRRREAAKRGIVQVKTPEEKRQESNTVLCRKRIKTAAHNRAIANKNRKKSIESKLRKYGKKDRQLHIWKDEFHNHQSKSTTSKASCVRINAGFTNPQGQEVGHHPHNAQRQVGDTTTVCDDTQNNICIVSQERKCKPMALTDATLNCKTVDSDGDNTHDDDSGECATITCEGKTSKKSAVEKAYVGSLSKISQHHLNTELNDTDNSHYRRASKRISNRKQFNNDRRSNEKKIDDDEMSISSTNFETDSTRSNSPLRTSRNANNSKSKKNHFQAAKLHRSVIKTRNTKHENKQCKFNLMSCFPAESALTLAAAFGDLQPSYSMKTTAKGTSSSAPAKWNIGESAMGIKQQLQRDVWRNMTLDMFTNSEYNQYSISYIIVDNNLCF